MKRAVCPMCGNASGHALAPQRALTDVEHAHKTNVAARAAGAAAQRSEQPV